MFRYLRHNQPTQLCRIGVFLCSCGLALTVHSQTTGAPAAPHADAPTAEQIATAKDQCLAFLLARQESLAKPEGDKAEWPYEGVYRVAGEIPIGYRIGGTAIAATALLDAPGLGDATPRKDAIVRAANFIIPALAQPLMSPTDYDGGYDVRGWGYTYALQFFLRCEDEKVLPDDLAAKARDAAKFCIDAIQKTAINEVGGWNYARSPGRDKVSPPSPFMTAPTLDALVEAKARGYEVDAGVVAKALDTLAGARTPSGSVMYAGLARKNGGDPTPGAVGRMLAANTTLYLAGRASLAELRGSLDAFLVHWPWLDQRRAKSGTHTGPYMIAPYYFYYAHRAAARAIELLPANERAEYRRRLLTLLFSVRQEDGAWNDRVFPRTASYGTASALEVLLAPQAKAPARWEAPAGEKHETR